MDTSDSPRTRPASTDTAGPHEPAGGPRTGPMRRMPRFTPRHDPASAGYDPAADAPAPPLPQRPPARPAPPAGWAPVPPPPAVSRGARPEPVRAVIGDEIHPVHLVRVRDLRCDVHPPRRARRA